MNSQKISWIRWKHVYFEYVFHGKVTPDVNCIVTRVTRCVRQIPTEKYGSNLLENETFADTRILFLVLFYDRRFWKKR